MPRSSLNGRPRRMPRPRLLRTPSAGKDERSAQRLLPNLCSHSAFLSSSFLELAYLVAELGGLLVGFARDRLVQLFPQLDQLRLRLLVVRQPPRRLAAVPGVSVDVLQQRLKLFAKLLVVVRAAEPAG